MKPLTIIRSRTAVLAHENIDTDRIIPARFLTTTEREGLGRYAFHDWRYRADGSAESGFRAEPAEGAGLRDPGGRPQLRLRLLARTRALGAAGLRHPRGAVSSEIADIFRSNALKNGLLAVVAERSRAPLPARASRHRTGHRRRRRHDRTARRRPLPLRASTPSPAPACCRASTSWAILLSSTPTQIDAFEASREARGMKASIVVLPGDGIGPEVTAAAVAVLQAVADGIPPRVPISDEHADRRLRHRRHRRSAARRDTRCLPGADAVLLGAVGGPKWSDPKAKVRPEQGLLQLRAALGVFANLRPVRVHPRAAQLSPVKADRLAGRGSGVRARTDRRQLFRRKARATPTAPAMSAATPWPKSSASLRRAFELAREPSQAGSPRSTRPTCWKPRACGGKPRQRVAAEYPGRHARTSAGRFDGDAADQPPCRLRRDGDREPVRRHPDRRSRGAGRLAGPAAVGLAGRRQARPVRADPRFGAGHRRPGHRQSRSAAS